MTLQEEYKDICKFGFTGTFEDYIEYKNSYDKQLKTSNYIPNKEDLIDDILF
jgi:hypothetical protein